jgi:hypothetical protein
MVSSPRVIAYENMIIDIAIDLLNVYGKIDLLKRSTLEEDEIKLKKTNDYKLR